MARSRCDGGVQSRRISPSADPTADGLGMGMIMRMIMVTIMIMILIMMCQDQPGFCCATEPARICSIALIQWLGTGGNHSTRMHCRATCARAASQLSFHVALDNWTPVIERLSCPGLALARARSRWSETHRVAIFIDQSLGDLQRSPQWIDLPSKQPRHLAC